MVTIEKPKRRDFRTFISIGILTTLTTIKQLILSKKMIGIIALCLIPIIIFSLWSAGAFPEEKMIFHANNYALEPELPEGIPDNDLEVSVDNTSINFEIIPKPLGGNIGKLSFTGTSDFLNSSSADYLEIQMFLAFEYKFKLNLLNIINESLGNSIIGPAETNEIIFLGTGTNNATKWSTWEFVLKHEFLVFIIQENIIQMAQKFGIPEEDIKNSIHLGFFIVAYKNVTGTERLVNSIYFELFPIFEGNAISSYGFVGVDVYEETVEEDGYEIFMNIATFFFFLFIIPLISMLFAISAIRDDIENHTIVYLITRPVSKTEILFWKYKGFFISSWVPIAISMCITFFIVSYHEGSVLLHINYLGILIGMMTLSVLVYGALFFLFAVISPYPIVISLLYVFFWETIIPNQLNVLNRLSILYHIQTIAHDTLGEIANVQIYQPINWVTSFFVLLGALIVILSLAIYLYNHRDFT